MPQHKYYNSIVELTHRKIPSYLPGIILFKFFMCCLIIQEKEKGERVIFMHCLHFMSSFPDTPDFFIRMCSPSSLRQMTRGVGCPVALHTSVASSPSCTDMSVEDSSFIMSGGTEKGKKRKIIDEEKVKRA